MYITREEAVDRLYDVISSGIISEELESDLADIATCIKHEEDNLFLWGAEDEASDLFIAKREDLIDDKWIEHLKQLEEKYRIKEI